MLWWMFSKGRRGKFSMRSSTTYSTDLRTFIEFALAQDPGARLILGSILVRSSNLSLALMLRNG